VVPYRIETSYSACSNTTSTVTGSRGNNTRVGCLVITPTRIPKEEDLSLPLPKENPCFDRVMKMRNTDGRPVQYSTWKPVRMYNGRDNIGTRNFKKVN
jgi:hypothetical protein